MAVSIGNPPGVLDYPVRAESWHATLTRWWPRLALISVLLLSAALEFAGLTSEGYANTYYAAAVKSMLTSWHNFFYLSFDAGGFVTVDKSPLGLWIQTGSAKLFGLNSLSILAPQALAGVASVGLIYHLVARSFGSVAGLVAALALAVTPIAAVVDRNNTIDSLLILTLLLGVWSVSKAGETGLLRYLLLSAVLLGLGFNIKMLQAYLVLPAFALAYWLGAPLRRRVRLGHLALAAGTLLTVSLAWLVAVDITPASDRPFVSDSGTNSALSLALGYNGLGRVTQALFSGISHLKLFGVTIDLSIVPAFASDIGNPSLFRLFQPALAEQISWLLPLALLGLCAAIVELHPRFPLDRRGQSLVLWAGWLLGAGVFFSTGRFYHLYYLAMLAPPIAALAGIGVTSLWRLYERAPSSERRLSRWAGWLMPATLLITAVLQVRILGNYSEWGVWLQPLVAVGSLIAALALGIRLLGFEILVAPNVLLAITRSRAVVAAAIAVALLIVSPAVWSVNSVAAGNGGSWLPQAGPSGGGGFGGGQMRGGGAGGPGFGDGQRPSGTAAQSTQPGPSGSAQSGSSLPTGNRGTFSGEGFGNGGRGQGGGFGGGGGGSIMTFAGSSTPTLDTKLVSYLLTNQKGAKYLVATTTSSYASLFILQTNQTAMALGGYQGWDNILTSAQLAKLVANNTVRYFYISSAQTGTMGSPGTAGTTTGSATSSTGTSAATTTATNNDATAGLTQWVRSHCSAVPSTQWQSTSSSTSSSGMQLYSCAALVK